MAARVRRDRPQEWRWLASLANPSRSQRPFYPHDWPGYLSIRRLTGTPHFQLSRLAHACTDRDHRSFNRVVAPRCTAADSSTLGKQLRPASTIFSPTRRRLRYTFAISYAPSWPQKTTTRRDNSVSIHDRHELPRNGVDAQAPTEAKN